MAVTKTRKAPLIEQFFAVRRFSSVLTFTADGSHLLFASNISGQFNLWRVPIEGGWPDQLTSFTEETVRGVAVSPTDGRILLCADHDGDEFHQLYLIEGERGWPEQLTNEPQVQHYVFATAWSPDGRSLAVVENSDKLLSIVSLNDGRRRTLTKFEAPLHSCDWSPNGRWIACTSGNWVSVAPGTMLGNSAPSTIVIIDPNNGAVREVTDRLNSNQSPVWAPDSQSLYFVSNRTGPTLREV